MIKLLEDFDSVHFRESCYMNDRVDSLVFGKRLRHLRRSRDLTLDQLFSWRPVAGYADYRTPIKSLYLCGSGTHPGGGISGINGRNASREILKDLKRRR